MKKLLVACLLFGAAPVFGQAAPPPRANAILVQVADSGAAAWKQAARVLAARGYNIKASDKDLLTLSTDARATGRAGAVVLGAVVQGHTVTLSGSFTARITGEASQRITYRGMGGSPFMVAWDELRATAAAMGGTVSYIQQP